MDDLARLFNQIEAVLWILLAVGFGLRSRKGSPAVRRLGRGTSATFLIFGISDLIEIRTGAWWSPWWLLVMKVACVACLLQSAVAYHRIRKSENSRCR